LVRGGVISGSIPDNSVVAGNPAKVIMTLDEYYHRRKERYITEAKEYIRIFIDVKHRNPQPSEMLAFWPLFMDRDVDELRKKGIRTNLGGDNEDEVIRDFLATEKVYPDLHTLINEALLEKMK
jgi:hypothetical protein